METLLEVYRWEQSMKDIFAAIIGTEAFSVRVCMSSYNATV